MDLATEHALRLIDEIARTPRETGPVRLGASYVAAVERIEALSGNQTGAEKTWVFNLHRRSRALVAGARRAR